MTKHHVADVDYCYRCCCRCCYYCCCGCYIRCICCGFALLFSETNISVWLSVEINHKTTALTYTRKQTSKILKSRMVRMTLRALGQSPSLLCVISDCRNISIIETQDTARFLFYYGWAHAHAHTRAHTPRTERVCNWTWPGTTNTHPTLAVW